MIMSELVYRIRRFYTWKDQELRDIFLSILAITFIFAYNDGRDVFSLIHWILNFVKVFIIVFGSFFAYDAGMRLSALSQGFIAEYKMWTTGIGLSLVFTLLTKGEYPLLLVGGLFLHHHKILRLGKFRHGINLMAYGSIAAAGPLANLLVMTVALALSKQLHILPSIFDTVARINGYMIIYQLLPIPKMNGIHIFFMSRLAYVFISVTIASYVILSFIGIYSWLIAFIIGTACWFTWYWFMEGGKV
jgi:hypothetical protein